MHSWGWVRRAYGCRFYGFDTQHTSAVEIKPIGTRRIFRSDLTTPVRPQKPDQSPFFLLALGTRGATPGSAASRLLTHVLTSERYSVILIVMAQAKRATVYLEPTLHRALRVKAAETDTSVSELVNDAVRFRMAEDAEDLEVFRTRAKEPSSPFENLVSDLKRRGKL
jgi:hypothetical protein